MSTFDVALFVAGFLTCEAIVIVFALSACRLAGAADDAADQALHDLTDRNSFTCVLTPPEDASPGAVLIPTSCAGGSLNHSFHAAIPSQKGRRDNA